MVMEIWEPRAPQTIPVTSDTMKVTLPLGDIVDRYSILSIKCARIPSAAAQKNIQREHSVLKETWEKSDYPAMESLPQWAALLQTNQALWTVEDELRALEKKQQFDAEFVALARSVYRLNDRRAELKRSINLSLGSTLIEEKSYSSMG